MKTIQYLLLLAVVAASCSPPNATGPVIDATNATFSPQEVNPPVGEKPTDVKASEKKIDTILTKYHGLVLREALDASPIKILTTSRFHNDELWPEAQTQTWIGLFSNETSHFLQRVDPAFEHVQDVIMDGVGEKTGWKVSTDLDAQCILLITGTQLAEGPVPTLGSEAALSIGDTLDVDLEIERTRIIFRGTRQDGFINDYQVILLSQSEGVLKQQVLIEESRYLASMMNLLWAGDLDGDDRLDLIIDTSNHENVTAPTLFLSSEANGDALVEPVAIHWTVGC